MTLENRNIELQFTILNCCKCGTIFGVPSAVNTRWLRERDDSSFYCPNGHAQYYVGKSDERRVKEAEAELQKEKQRREWAEHNTERARESAQRAEYSRRAEKAAKTRIKNRVANGVCPCCNRTFQDLQRHMTTKHPDYAATE